MITLLDFSKTDQRPYEVPNVLRTFRLPDCPRSYQKGLFPRTVTTTVYSYYGVQYFQSLILWSTGPTLSNPGYTNPGYTHHDRLTLFFLHSGTLPDDWSDLASLSFLSFGGNPLITGALPTSWFPEVTDEPSSYYRLGNLKELDGSDCGLTGSLPSNLGGMQKVSISQSPHSGDCLPIRD